MPAPADALRQWTQRYLAEEQPRSKSLIVTVFGDALVPRQDSIWLSELIELMAPFGINERLVRTSAFRLTEEDWLRPTREGRRSRYALTDAGRRKLEHAYRRVYAAPPGDWDGQWTLVILPRGDYGAPERAGLRRELEWEGFGVLAPGLLIHPGADLGALREVLDGLQLADRAVVTRARDLPRAGFRSIADQVGSCWNLDDVAAGYRRFIARFEPLADLVDERIDASTAFVVQTLLIHSHRRLVLHDPRLPAPLLPPDWPGQYAYALCRTLYGRLHRAASGHIERRLGTGPEARAPAIAERFGSSHATRELEPADPRQP